MSSETTTTSERDEQLRRLLVATSTAEAVKAPKKSRTLIGSIVAFAVAGAVTGGAISAAALSSDQPSTTPTSISIEDMTEHVVHDDTQLFGTPFIIRSVGVTDIDLGRAPAGATSIALAFHCVSAGSFEYTLDGKPVGAFTCTNNDTRYTNGAGFLEPGGSKDHTLRISTGAEDSFVIWPSWAAQAPKAPPSAAQEEAIADGVASEVEYRDGFDRNSECMSDAGYPVGSLRPPPIMNTDGEVVTRRLISGHNSRSSADARNRRPLTLRHADTSTTISAGWYLMTMNTYAFEIWDHARSVRRFPIAVAHELVREASAHHCPST